MEIYHPESCSCYDKDYFLFIFGNADAKVIINYISINFECVCAKFEFDIASANDQEFIKNKIKQFKVGARKLKCAIVDIFGMKTSKKRYLICNFWKAYCNEYGIYYQFINSTTLAITSILHRVNITDIGWLTLVHITKNKIIIFDIESNFEGFIVRKHTSLNLDCSDKLLKDTVMKGKKSSKIILSIDDSSNTRLFETILKSPKLVVLANNHANVILKALETLVNDLTGACKNNCKIKPYFESDIFITKQQNSDRCYGSFEIKFLKNTILPFSATADTFVTDNEIGIVNLWNGKNLEPIEKFYVSKHAGFHLQLMLSIDVNGFHELHINQQKNVPLSLLHKRQQDAYINFDDEDGDGKISITIPDIGKLKDENGNATISSYISFFHNDMPVIGEQALKLSTLHPSFVVYDIFKLIKMAATTIIKSDPKWGFKVDKDSTGTLQVIFNTWRGTRKATPQFLLAILINHMLKLAKERLGFVPKVVDIIIGDNFRFLEKEITAALKRLDKQYKIQSDRSKRIIRVDKVDLNIIFKNSGECINCKRCFHR